MRIEPAIPDHLDSMVALAAHTQSNPQTHIAYVGSDRDAVVAEIQGVAGWTDHTTVAFDGDRLVGWLLAERDQGLGRTWWWGPFVDSDDWDGLADRLYAAAVDPSFTEEELVSDVRSGLLPAFAERHGFHAEEGSALLALNHRPSATSSIRTEPAAPVHLSVVADLHDRLFPRTHTPGSSLSVESDSSRSITVVVDGGRTVGYVVTSMQHDDSLYVDYLGVDETHRRRGIGRALVLAACEDAERREASFVHLSVRESNSAARRLYRSLGFVEERVIRPYRKGFSIP